MLARDYSIAELRGVRHEPVIFDRNAIEQVDRDLLAFAHGFGASDNHRVEKRSSPRHAVIATLTAQEFDQQLHPVGPPFQTVCRNLSTSGLCLINGHPIGCDFLVIELSAPGAVLIQTLARVLRRRPLGPYHDIGIEFVTKLANSNTKRTEQ
ncbi:MAG: PilZ domain-containing protein [Planctomycetota bacterium]